MTEYPTAGHGPWRRMDREELVERLATIASMHRPEASDQPCPVCGEPYPCSTLVVARGGEL